MAALVILLILAAAPAAAEEPFSAAFRAATLEYLDASPSAAARETAGFLRAAPELSFRRRSAEEPPLDSDALYDPRTRVIEVAAQTLLDAGVPPGHPRPSPQALASAVGRIAPLLVHELAHARHHRELGSLVPLFEDELAAYAQAALFTAQVPELATARHHAAGLEFLRRHRPLSIERFRLIEEKNGLLIASRGGATAAAAARVEEVRARIADVEGRLRPVQDELIGSLRLPLGLVDLLAEWAAFTQGWDAFTASLAFVTQPSLDWDEERVAAYIERTRGLKAMFPGDAALAARCDAAVAFWSDPAARQRARAYYAGRLRPLREASGKGFTAPETRPPAAPRWPAWRALLFVAGGLLVAAALLSLARARD